MPELADSKELVRRIREESKAYMPFRKEKGEFSRREFRDANNVSADQAIRMLDQMEQDGKVVKRQGGAKKAIFYRFVDELK